MKRFLYDILADKWLNKNGSIKIYSDPHFGNIECYKMRHLVDIPDKKDYLNKFKDSDSFESYESFVSKEVIKADLEQIKNINKEVGKNDTIIFLGDIGDVECIKKIKGYKILIMGNHDKGASNYKRVIEYLPHKHMDNYDILVPVVYKGIGNIDIKDTLVKHYAIEREDKDIITFDNHLFDEVYEGPLMINDRVILSHEPIAVPEYMYNIHGHVHNKDYKGDNNHLNVCAESINYKPVDILSLFKKRILKNIHTIHRETIDKTIDRKEKKEGNKNGKKVK